MTEIRLGGTGRIGLCARRPGMSNMLQHGEFKRQTDVRCVTEVDAASTFDRLSWLSDRIWNAVESCENTFKAIKGDSGAGDKVDRRTMDACRSTRAIDYTVKDI